ncbi:MAG: hypothetical protein IKA88_06250 [Clostridia bacterium]|nr:hypothetical protein [Clostridia bacterium]
MHNLHSRNTVRYYLLLVLGLLVLFFSNDFGLLDVQKTAIVLAAGIDRDADSFIVTSQISIPQSSTQGKQTQAVQIVSRGKTVADAFDEINAKTGWYPKLVFCDLIVLGSSVAEQNVFDALDFFLRDEYLTDNCLLATCDGTAKEILNASALVDPSSSVAIQKVLSAHAERVGTALPVSLREFSIGYFSDSKSGFLPVLKTEPQQEKIGNEGEQQGGSNGSGGAGGSGSSGSSGGEQSQGQAQGEASGGQKNSESGQSEQNKPVFSAGETALFVNGKRVETLTREETFALCAVTGKLRLASYAVERNGDTCTLTVKRNSPSVKLQVGKDGMATLNVDLTMTAGVLDYSVAQSMESISDAGDVSKAYLSAAEKKLAGEIHRVFEKSRACGCDVFRVRERLVKYKNRRLRVHQDTVLSRSLADVKVRFENVR